MKHGGALFPLLLVGVLAGLSFWLQGITEPGVDRSGRLRHDPDFIVDNFSVRRFDVGGTLQHTVVSRRMAHFPDDDTTHLEAPRMDFHRQPPAVLTANTAWISRDAKEVRLEGNVRFVRGGADGFETVVATSLLNIFPDEETARTDAPVNIAQGLSTIDGTGLVMDNKIQTATLLGPVRGTIHRKPDSERKSP